MTATVETISVSCPRLAKKRTVLQTDTEDSSDEDHMESESHSELECNSEAGPSRPKRRGILPACFRNESEHDDGVLCSICGKTEPENKASNTVFWLDCDLCGTWVHNYCAFNNNTVAKRYSASNVRANYYYTFGHFSFFIFLRKKHILMI